MGYFALGWSKAYRAAAPPSGPPPAPSAAATAVGGGGATRGPPPPPPSAPNVPSPSSSSSPSSPSSPVSPSPAHASLPSGIADGDGPAAAAHAAAPAATPAARPRAPLVWLATDPPGRYLATATARGVVVWSAGQHRVLLGRHHLAWSPPPANGSVTGDSSGGAGGGVGGGTSGATITPTTTGGIRHCAWSPSGSVLALATDDGLVRLLSVDAVPLRDGRAGVLDIHAGASAATAASLAADGAAPPRSPLPPVSLTVVADVRVAHAPSGSLSALAPAAAGALAGTSAGGLVCVGWDGVLLWRTHVPELLRRAGGLGLLGLPRGALAALAAERSAAAATQPPTPSAGGRSTVVGANSAAVSVPPLQGLWLPVGSGGGGSGCSPAETADDRAGWEVLGDLLTAAGDDSGGGVAAIAYDRRLGLVGLVLGSGASFLLRLRAGGRVRPSCRGGLWLRSAGGLSIALSPVRLLATVGRVDGDVEHFSLGALGRDWGVPDEGRNGGDPLATMVSSPRSELAAMVGDPRSTGSGGGRGGNGGGWGMGADVGGGGAASDGGAAAAGDALSVALRGAPAVRRLSLSSWYFEPEDVGGASVLSWSADGAVLAVGWARRGLAVWSVSGCRLMWTLPQVGGPLPSTPAASRAGLADASAGEGASGRHHRLMHPMEAGVAAAGWAPTGLYLWAAPRRSAAAAAADTTGGADFMEFAFARSGTAGSTAFFHNEATRISLLGPDRVLLLTHSGGGGGGRADEMAAVAAAGTISGGGGGEEAESAGAVAAASGDGAYAWQHVQIPLDYLWSAWPPRLLAVNDAASHVAIAGDSGVAICHVRTQRWRLFGDAPAATAGGQIRAVGLAWFGRHVLVANEVPSPGAVKAAARREAAGGGGSGVWGSGGAATGGVDTSSYELLAYSRDRFDASGLQARRALPGRPLRVDVRADGYVFVLCAGSLGIMFCVVETGAGLAGLDMHEVYELRLPSVVRRRPRVAAAGKGGARRRGTAGASSPAVSPRLATSTTGFDVGDYGYHGEVETDAADADGEEASAWSTAALDEEADDEAEAAYLVLPSGASALAPASEEVAEVRLFPPTDRVGVGDAAAAAVAARGLPSAERAPTRMMILTAAGDLLLLDAEVGMYAHLLADVEQLWFTPADCPPLDGVSESLRPLWWAYGADGLQVCFPDGMAGVLAALDASAGGAGAGSAVVTPVASSTSLASLAGLAACAGGGGSADARYGGVVVEQWLELDPEVYPLGLLAASGLLVVGTTQGLEVGAGIGAFPRHVVRVKRQPVLHTLLRHILVRRDVGGVDDDGRGALRVALRVALRCASQPQFVDSLEWLLYEAVLEHNDERRQRTRSAAATPLALVSPVLPGLDGGHPHWRHGGGAGETQSGGGGGGGVGGAAGGIFTSPPSPLHYAAPLASSLDNSAGRSSSYMADLALRNFSGGRAGGGGGGGGGGGVGDVGGGGGGGGGCVGAAGPGLLGGASPAPTPGGTPWASSAAMSADLAAAAYSAAAAGQRELFPRVIRLLRYFGEYEDVVVRCARKMDSKRWPLLFAVAGEPAALLEQCFVSGRLRTAACLLVILQEMWGFISSTPHSLRLLDAALERGELGLAADLANFLSKADRAGMLNSSQLTAREDVGWMAAATARPSAAAPPRPGPWGTVPDVAAASDGDAAVRLPAVDLSVLKSARRLLADGQWRRLAALSVRMDFPLAAWLRREVYGKGAQGSRGGGGGTAAVVADGETPEVYSIRQGMVGLGGAGGGAGVGSLGMAAGGVGSPGGRSPPRTLVGDMAGTLLALHRQFQWPEPPVRAVEATLTRLVRERAAAAAPTRAAAAAAATAASVAAGASPAGSPIPADATANGGTGGGAADGAEAPVTPRTVAWRANAALTGKEGEAALFGTALPPPGGAPADADALRGMRAKARRLCAQELTYLLAVAAAARAPELSLLFGTLLLDAPAVAAALDAAPGLWPSYRDALCAFGVRGYTLLASTLEELREEEARGGG